MSFLNLNARYRILTSWSTKSNITLTLSSAPKKRTRIQIQNESRIIQAALDVFSAHGYRGSTVDQIADSAGMSKANILYYFSRKQDIYAAVLGRTLNVWLDPLEELNPDGDPVEEILQYALQKLRLSKESPHASRLFANEILHGAPVIKPFLEKQLKELVERKCKTLQAWINAGKITPIAPMHLLFLIWSTTQHYADFEPQISALSDDDDEKLFNDAEHMLRVILGRGLRP